MRAEQALRLGEGVLVHEGRLVDEILERSWKLNSTGRFIVAAVESGATFDEIVERYGAEHELEAEIARRDVTAVLSQLRRSKLLADPRRRGALALNNVQRAILRHPVVLTLSMGLMRCFDWYFALILKILGGKRHE